MVIRIGHLGQSFYFIFTGLLAITKDKDGTSAFLTKEPILIRKGMSFGVRCHNESVAGVALVSAVDWA